MNTCNNCGTETSHKKYTLCPSCSHLGNQSNKKYDQTISGVNHVLYPLYKAIIHHKCYGSPSLDVEKFVVHLLTNHTEDELLGSAMLIREDVDKEFGIDNYKLSATRQERGKAKKQAKDSTSQYVGVSAHKDRFEATIKGKYIRGSSQPTEYESCLVRDEYIIDNGLEDKYRLQVL